MENVPRSYENDITCKNIDCSTGCIKKRRNPQWDAIDNGLTQNIRHPSQTFKKTVDKFYLYGNFILLVH